MIDEAYVPDVDVIDPAEFDDAPKTAPGVIVPLAALAVEAFRRLAQRDADDAMREFDE